MSSNRVVVVGAGVIGLTTALILSKNKSNDVTVAAKHMPGDYDIEYCSPFAGANYLPVGAEGSPLAEWEKNTWPVLKELAEKHPDAGIHFQSDYEYATANAVDPKADTKPTDVRANNRLKDANSKTGQWFKELVKADPWYKDVVPDYRVIPKEQLPSGIDNGFVFTSVCINSAVYLAWLVSQCRKNGVVFKRAIFKHIADAANAHHSGKKADVVVNCTGLSSKKLGGVEDQKLYPARGQTVLVRNEIDAMGSLSGCDDGDDEVCYTMMRAAGGGTILGGSYQKHNWESQPDPNLAVRIMKRCIQLNPELVGTDESGKPRGIEALSIIRHGVGLRPLREGGTRIEREIIDGVSVVHNYGHGGFGYQSSYGSCSAAVRLVEQALNDVKSKARL